MRPMRRSAQQVSDEECVRILTEAKRAVLSVIDGDGSPYGVPVNFVYRGGYIYIHGAKEGHKLDCIRADGRVCFTVWGGDYREEGDWSYHVTSVIVRGRAELIEDIGEITEMVRGIGNKHSPYPEEVERDIESAISRVGMIRITVDSMTGKLVHER